MDGPWTAHGALDDAARRLGLVALCPEALEKTERGWTDSGSEEFELDRESVVKLNGTEVFRGLAWRNLGALARAALRNDGALSFSASVAPR